MPGKTIRKPRKKAKRVRVPKEASTPAASVAADRFIADQLKAIYDSVVAETVPDRLLQLLDRLDGDAEK